MRLGQILPIRHQSIFTAVSRFGAKFSDANLLLIYLSYSKLEKMKLDMFAKYHASYYYLGFKISRKFGKAVIRNKVKRRLRALCAQYIKYETPPLGYIILIPRQSSINSSFEQLAASFSEAMTKVVRYNRFALKSSAP